MDETKLIEKLRLVEALFAGAATSGERDAAASAMARIRARLDTIEREDPPVEYQFSMADMWSRRLFTALLRRYGMQPYRFSGQRHTTVMAKISKRFVDETLWPEFCELKKVLHTYLDESTERVIRQSIFSDDSEAEVRHELPGKRG